MIKSGKKYILLGMFIGGIILSGCSSDKGKCEWVKYANNPVLGGGDLGTIFDISVLKDGVQYDMYSSWRPQKGIALSTSNDGINWTHPKIVLPGIPDSDWEIIVNRPVVLKKDGIWHMWYTGQNLKKKISKIGYATSTDGVNFKRYSDKPVMEAEYEWEKPSVMCPHVEWDESEKLFKMWYSGGENFEPNAIGYATSSDGVNWKKYPNNPVFKNNPSLTWEKERTTACQVVKHSGMWYMFYIGFEDIHTARIGLARSNDGINWERNPKNPIIQPTPNGWDADATYKPFAIYDGEKWLLWYNGRTKTLERIGLAICESEELF